MPQDLHLGPPRSPDPSRVSVRLASCLQLDILAGRLVTSGGVTVKGQVQVNGEHMDRANIRRLVSYVRQEDYLPPTETVRECLQFNADMLLPSVSKTQRVDRVGIILDSLVRPLHCLTPPQPLPLRGPV